MEEFACWQSLCIKRRDDACLSLSRRTFLGLSLSCFRISSSTDSAQIWDLIVSESPANKNYFSSYGLHIKSRNRFNFYAKSIPCALFILWHISLQITQSCKTQTQFGYWPRDTPNYWNKSKSSQQSCQNSKNWSCNCRSAICCSRAISIVSF